MSCWRSPVRWPNRRRRSSIPWRRSSGPCGRPGMCPSEAYPPAGCPVRRRRSNIRWQYPPSAGLPPGRRPASSGGPCRRRAPGCRRPGSPCRPARASRVRPNRADRQGTRRAAGAAAQRRDRHLAGLGQDRQSDGDVLRARQDHRAHHHVRRGDQRDRAVRRAAGDAAGLLHAPADRDAQHRRFVEVDEVTLQGEIQRLFTGWMFAASPGLHAVEHPIYDVWLADCKGPQTVTSRRSRRAAAAGAASPPHAPAAAEPRPPSGPPPAAPPPPACVRPAARREPPARPLPRISARGKRARIGFVPQARRSSAGDTGAGIPRSRRTVFR